jgi:hypothetical protein
MTMRTKIVITVIAVVLLIIAVNIAQAQMEWECHGQCYGCELWNCKVTEGSECCAYCWNAGQQVWCCYPDLCNAIEN